MSKAIDWPQTRPPQQGRRRFLLILAVFFAIVLFGRTILSYYVDALWFGSLGYGDVFWKTLSLRGRSSRRLPPPPSSFCMDHFWR